MSDTTTKLDHPVVRLFDTTLRAERPGFSVVSAAVDDDTERDRMRVTVRIECRDGIVELPTMTILGQADMTDREWYRTLRYEFRRILKG